MFGVLIIYYGTYNNRRYYYITHKLQTLRRYVMLASQQMSALPLLLIDLQPQLHTYSWTHVASNWSCRVQILLQ